MVPFLSALIYFFLLITSIFLVCLVLIQRGKGGGLAGAFGGGSGSSSAFGSKAGDVFTRVTMITAGIWIALNMVLVVLSNQRTSAWGDTPTPGSASKSTFTSSPDKNQGTGKAIDATPAATPAVGSGADALLPGNPSAPAPSPLGNGGTTPTSKAAGTSGATSDMPDPFSVSPVAPSSPLPVGSTPSGGGNNPKP